MSDPADDLIHVHLDFETFSESDIKVIGGTKYAEHPSTDILCLVYAVGDEEPVLLLPDDFMEWDIAHGYLPEDVIG